MFSITLVPDQEISILAYKGEEREARKFANIASRYRCAQLPMPIDGCKLGIMIGNISVIKVPIQESPVPIDYRTPIDKIEKIDFKIEYAVMLSGILA